MVSSKKLLCVIGSIVIVCILVVIGVILFKNCESYNPQNTISLRTVNYNVFGRWLGLAGYEGQTQRLQNIPYAIKAHPKMGPDVDVITIEEAWCPDTQFVSGPTVCDGNASRDILVDSMKINGWPYHTNVVDKPGVSVFTKQTSGGAMIFSKWPILATSQYVYKTCKGQDCSAAKGAVYIRILKTAPNGVKQVFNVVGTHLQAWSTPEGKTARQGQLQELIGSYVPAIGIPSNGTEPLLFQGDMNTDYVLYPEEVDTMLQILKAKLPARVPDSLQIFSSDPSTNFLVGKDGAASDNKCLSAYKASLGKSIVPLPAANQLPRCTNIPSKTASGAPLRGLFTNKDGTLKVEADCRAYCPCCPHEMLDYILYSTENKYLQPLTSSIEIIPLKSTVPLTYKWGWCEGAKCLLSEETHNLTGRDLSDHYPVVANFTFQPVTTTFPLLDGCKSDNDCNLKAFGKASCYCDGPGCTLMGKKVNGWDAGADSKVNANCHFRASTAGSCFCRPGNE